MFLTLPPGEPTEQRRRRYEMEGQTAGIGDSFPEESWDGKLRDASVL